MLWSQDRTTHGNPLVIPMYALVNIPLIDKTSSSVFKVWHADDTTTALGSINDLCNWWDNLCLFGPGFCYFANTSKIWPICKEHCYSVAVSVFADTNVNVTTVRRHHLGVTLGTQHYVKSVCHRESGPVVT